MVSFGLVWIDSLNKQKITGFWFAMAWIDGLNKKTKNGYLYFKFV